MDEQFTPESISFTVNDDGTITAMNNYPAEEYRWAVHDVDEQKAHLYSKWEKNNTFHFPKITKDSRYVLKALIKGVPESRVFFRFEVCNGEMPRFEQGVRFPPDAHDIGSILNRETLASAGYTILINEFPHLDDAEFADIDIEFESIFKRHGLDAYLYNNRVCAALRKYAAEINKAHDSCTGTTGLCCIKRLYAMLLYFRLLNFSPDYWIPPDGTNPTLAYFLEDEVSASRAKRYTDKNKGDINNILLIDYGIPAIDKIKALLAEAGNVINIRPDAHDSAMLRHLDSYYKYGRHVIDKELMSRAGVPHKAMMFFLGLLANSRDFVNLKNQVLFAVVHKIALWEHWLAAWLEIQILVEKIKLLISRRKSTNHILFFQDAFRYRGAEKMGFKLLDNLTVGLHNYYAFAAWTRQSFYSIMKGESYFKYSKDSKDSKNKLSEIVDKHGFDMINVAYDDRSGGLVARETGTKNRENPFPSQEWHASLECWKILAELCKTKTNSVVLAHSMDETHSGAGVFSSNKTRVLSKKYRDLKNGIITEIDAAAAYKECTSERLKNLSRQFDYYIPIMTANPNNKLVLTADHGQVPKYFFNMEAEIAFYNFYQQEAYHIPFYLFNYDDKFKALKKVMLSHIDFHQTLEALISGDIAPLLEGNDYVRHEDLPAYGYLQNIMAGKTDEQKRLANLCGAVSITTRTDKYMFLADGRESYFILPYDYKPEHDLIDEPHYRERISYLRSLVERDFWDRFWSERRDFDAARAYFLGDQDK